MRDELPPEALKVPEVVRRCSYCGIKVMGLAEMCDNGTLCAGFYGDEKTRLKVIQERDLP